MKNFIDIVDLNFTYNEGNNAKSILNGINLNIKKGEFLAILGCNGSGKSTLIKHLNAMLLPTKGNVFVKGMNTKDERKIYDIRSTVGLILQNPDNQIVASIVEDDVAFGPENLGVAPKVIRERVDMALKLVDMYDYRKSTTYSLSGGQKQRVAIAGIIAMQPECILLDEPTSMLDPEGRKEVLDTIKNLNKNFEITIVLITHYMEEAVNADRIAIINEGKIVRVNTPRAIFSDIIFLKEYQLSIPPVVELIHKLRLNGINLNNIALDEKECINILKNYFNSFE